MDGRVIHLLPTDGRTHTLHTTPHQAFDCWCEPNRLTWLWDHNAHLVLVVEHNEPFDWPAEGQGAPNGF